MLIFRVFAVRLLRYVSKYTACRFAEKTLFFRALLAVRRCAASYSAFFQRQNALFLSGEGGPAFHEQAQSLATMAARILFRAAEFGSGLAEFGIKKDGVIAEAVLAAGFIQNAAFPRAAHDKLPAAEKVRLYGGHAADKAAVPGGFRQLGEAQEQLAHIALIPAFSIQRVPVVTVTGGVDARRAVQRIHFQSGVVGDGDVAGQLRHGPGLEQRIFLKGRAGFLYFSDAEKFEEMVYRKKEIGEEKGSVSILLCFWT